MLSIRYSWLLCCLSLTTLSSWAQNDDCAGALSVAEGVNGPFDNSLATESSSWPCGAGLGFDLWYSFTAPSDGMVTADTCTGTNFDTRLEVFEGTCGSLTSLACNDDACFVYSRVDWAATAGTTYLLRVGGYNGTTGTFDLRIDHVPLNDECAGALALVDGSNGPFDNTTASESGPAWPCGGSGAAFDLWFSYTASCTGAVTFDTCSNTNFDTRIEVFDGLCGPLNSLDCNDDACGLQSSVSVNSTTGQMFLVRVAGFGGATGTFDLEVTCVTPPTNDECATALPIVDGPNGPFSSVLATDSPEAWTCGGGSVSSDVWFTYTATCDGDVTVDTCTNGQFDTRMQVFDGVCGSLNLLDCNDDSCGLQSAVTFPATSGTTYTIRVGGFNGAAGTFELTATCSVPNDECTGAIPVIDSGNNINIITNGPFSNQGATTSPEPFACGSSPGADVWFSYVATCTGNLSVTTCNLSAMDTVIELFRGSCGSLTSIGCNDDSCGTQSDAQAPVTMGETIYIRVAGAMGAMGTFDLLLSYDNGTGSFSTFATGNCGGAQIVVTGAPNIGGIVRYSITGGTGVQTSLFFGTIALGIPICPAACVLGTDFGIVFPHDTPVEFAWDCDPNFIGFQYYFQGIDIGGVVGGCNFGPGLEFTLTDTILTTIGN